jgi:hypothetical protein
MSLIEVCRWLEHTALSTSIRESEYLFPIVEGAHLLSLSIFLGSALMYDLRLVGALWRSEPVSRVKAQFLPIEIVGFACMVMTGSLLFLSEPVRCYQSAYFRTKVLLLTLAGLNAFVFHVTVDRRAEEWNLDAKPPLQAQMAGYLSIALWIGVVAAGRFTAYNLS